MATRPFAFNTGSTINGTIQVGNIAIGVDQLDYYKNVGGVTWWSGPDETNQYIICVPIPERNQPTPMGNIGSVGFYGSPKTDTDFINMVNQMSGQAYTNISDAQKWVSSQNYWTNYNFKYLTTNLIGCYDLEEPSGTTVYSSNNTLSGTSYNSPTLRQNGIVNYCYYFNSSSDQYVRFPSPLITSFPYSVSFWFNFNGSATNVICLNTKTNIFISVGLQVYSTKLSFTYGDNTSNGSTGRREWAFNCTINSGIWYHAVFTATAFGSTYNNAYLNGVKLSYSSTSGSANTVVFSAASELGTQFAHSLFGTAQYTGYLDQISIWNRELTYTEILLLYNSGNGLSYANWQ